MKPVRIFISSVQKELELERAAVTEFGVANDTAGRDLKGLTELGLLKLVGKGRAVRYVAKTTDNRPTQS